MQIAGNPKISDVTSMKLGSAMNDGNLKNPEIGNALRQIPEYGNTPFPAISHRTLTVGRFAAFAALASTLILSGNSGPVRAQTPGKLNDTGVITCANESSNNLPCGYADGDPNGHTRQEAEYGRAAKEATSSLTKTGTSDANSKGFDFSKVLYNGTVRTGATQTDPLGPASTRTNWGCTKDNVTGLVWAMVLTTADDARLNTNTFNWKYINADFNGGAAYEGATGTASGTTCFSSTCDTHAHIAYINGLTAANNICGFTDWRLPTRLELLSIVDASKQGTGVTTVDASFFPNVMPDRYWTRDNLAGNPQEARTVSMASGTDGTASKSSKLNVILVRP